MSRSAIREFPPYSATEATVPQVADLPEHSADIRPGLDLLRATRPFANEIVTKSWWHVSSAWDRFPSPASAHSSTASAPVCGMKSAGGWFPTARRGEGGFFILDDPIFGGLAVSLIFGLLVSTVLTLLVIPVVYYAYRWRKAGLDHEGRRDEESRSFAR